MHLEFLVEEPSAEAALQHLLPRVFMGKATFLIHAHKSKNDLLASLPGRLRGYRSWMPEDWRIVVLIDEDRKDCRELKQRLEKMAWDAGLLTKSTAAANRQFQVINRLVIEELEAWFFGDPMAICQAYPHVKNAVFEKPRYRDPDAIAGGTWESLERILQKAGYYAGGLPKIEVALNISKLMDPARNRSRSFQVFCEGIRACLR